VGFFSWRRKKESAIPESTDAALGSFANAEGQPVVGKQVGGGAPPINVQGMDLTDSLAMLSQLGPMIQQAMATGNVQITQGEPQTIDMRGTDLGEQLKGIMAQHGIDPEKGTVNVQGDTNTYLEMQQQILQALAQHGIDPNASGTSINVTNVEIEGDEGTGELPGGQS
jgi:hypothetical protein